MQLSATDEDRHLPGTDIFWGESWYHDFAAADGSYGGYLRLGLYPNQKVAWSWVYLVRKARPLFSLLFSQIPNSARKRVPQPRGAFRIPKSNPPFPTRICAPYLPRPGRGSCRGLA